MDKRAEDRWRLAAGDITCAFLTGSYLSRELYIHQPPTGFPGMKPNELVRVKKNVFGLATSPHEWWGDLQRGIGQVNIPDPKGDGTLRFDQCPLDPCVFMLRRYRPDSGFVGEPVAYLGCHVDDLLIAAPGSLLSLVQNALSVVFPIDSWEDDNFDFLGSRISTKDGLITMDQERYTTTRLFYLDIPAGVDEQEVASTELIADNRSLIGALSWLSAQTRPDMTCAVSMAQQLQKEPTYGDLKFTNSIAAKAQSFKDRGLTFKAISEGQLMFIAYHDAAWANVPEPDLDEEYYKLSVSDDERGVQHEGPYAYKNTSRKAKKGRSKVASQLGCLILFADRRALQGCPSNFSIADWRSRAGQRVCRSTFGAETQACVEGLESAEFMRSLYESMSRGSIVDVESAELPIVCLSDCRSLYDHLTKQGVPRVPSDKRLAVDLASLRQALKLEMWCEDLPLGWIPGSLQLGDILTKPQNPTEWWERQDSLLVVPISIGGEGGTVNNKKAKWRTSVKLEDSYLHGKHPSEYFVID